MGGQVLEHEGKRIYNEGIAKGEAKGRAEGEAIGEAKGRAEGEAKGRAEGKAEGKAEGAMIEREKISVNMFHKGISIDMIAQCVGVSANLIRQWIQDPANAAART